MDRPGGGGRDEAEGSKARARVGATGGGGGAGEIEGGRWARGSRQASIVLLRRGRRPDRLLRFTAGPGAGELRDGPQDGPGSPVPPDATPRGPCAGWARPSMRGP